ncbi:MAG: GNAT family N-acetyltransferase [Phycisphaerales bacterium]
MCGAKRTERIEQPVHEVALEQGAGNVIAARMRGESADSHDAAPAQRRVEVLGTSGSFDTATAIDELIAWATDTFAKEEPVSLRICRSAQSSAELDALTGHARVAVRRWILAAPFHVVRSSKMDASLLERIEIRVPSDLSFYDAYVGMYQRFWDDQPHMRGVVPVEPVAHLQAMHVCGGLRLVMVDGDFAGVFAAKPRQLHVIDGWCMGERIIAREFRGQGLGPAVLQLFLRDLPVDGETVLFGRIAPENAASLRSAERLGRRCVLAEYALELRDHPHQKQA